MTRIIPTEKENYTGPCAFERGQGPEGASYDLCKAMANSHVFGKKCEGCASPYHPANSNFVPGTPKVKLRPELRDYAPTGLGPRTRGTAFVAPPHPDPKPPKPDRPPRERGSYCGAKLLAAFEKVCTVRGGTDDRTEMHKLSGVPYELVLKLVPIPDLSQEMREIILRMNMSIGTLTALRKLPHLLQMPAVNAIEAGKMKATSLEWVLRQAIELQRHSLREWFARAGLREWPEGLNDDGTQKQA